MKAAPETLPTITRIKPKWGFWDTTSYPYGGKFSRAGTEGLQVAEVVRQSRPHEYEVILADGRRAVVELRAVEVAAAQ